MRIDIKHPDARYVTVLFNGNPLKECIWADEATGEVEIYVVNEHTLYAARMGWEIPKKILRGRVCIVFTRKYF